MITSRLGVESVASGRGEKVFTTETQRHGDTEKIEIEQRKATSAASQTY